MRWHRNSTSTAVFDIEKKNVVTPTGVTGVSEAAGKVGSQGIELDVTGRIAERWDMIGTYAYTHTEVLDDPSNKGNRLSQHPSTRPACTSPTTCKSLPVWATGTQVAAHAMSANALATMPTLSI